MLRNSRAKRIDRNRRNGKFRHLLLEALEDRSLLAGFVGIPNDPGFPGQWPLHNTGQTGGTVDADIDAPEAWSVTTGSMATVVAILDGAVDYTHPDLYLNIWLNPGEIPASIGPSLTDTDSDGLITFRDLNSPANSSFVVDVNANGYIDGGDLLADWAWENGVDEDGNGRVDDLVGWDFHDNDNDPFPPLNDTHGTEVSQRIAAIGNNGVGTLGVMWTARLMPVRIQGVTNGDRIIENAVAGLDYVVAAGATISNNSWGDFIYSQVMFDALDRARLANHLFVTSAGNDSQDIDVTPRYPAAYDLDNIISVLALDATDQLTPVGSWGQVNVDLGAPTDTGANSKATPHVTGVAGLLRSVHPDWTYAQIKAQILATVDPVPSLAGKCVTGGRLNAANALGVVQNTKFYVVDDATANRTFEYNSGTSLAGETYNLSAGNAAPRGAASTAAGDKVWVVDANKSVYVYNTTGGLLGSWTAGSLPSNAQVQGIATNGTDIWIVDGKQDKVFRYTGAASRLSGSQNVASSFSLNSGNKEPKDIVTDGSSLWVVNNSTTDKVFKYSVSGSLLGSWTISTSGAGSPTGITIDPSNVSDIWIVDSLADKVFQYTAAASRTSGSQAAAASFALATGNTNPQGIADPPPPGDILPGTSPTPEHILHHVAIDQLMEGSKQIDRSEPTPVRKVSVPQHPVADFPPGQAKLPPSNKFERTSSLRRPVVEELFASWDQDDLTVNL